MTVVSGANGEGALRSAPPDSEYRLSLIFRTAPARDHFVDVCALQYELGRKHPPSLAASVLAIEHL